MLERIEGRWSVLERPWSVLDGRLSILDGRWGVLEGRPCRTLVRLQGLFSVRIGRSSAFSFVLGR